MGEGFVHEKGSIRGGGAGRSQGCAGRLSSPLLLAQSRNYLSGCMGSGHWLSAGRSPTCFFGERGSVVPCRADPGDAAARPLAPPALLLQDPLSACVSLFLCHPCPLIGQNRGGRSGLSETVIRRGDRRQKRGIPWTLQSGPRSEGWRYQEIPIAASSLWVFSSPMRAAFLSSWIPLANSPFRK
jgi:hypothetical protein